MIAEEDWDRAVKILTDARDVVVACHISPDGDALGSAMSLGRYLKRKGKTVWVTWGSPVLQVPPQYAFMPGVEDLVAPADVPERVETFVSVDCADRARLGVLQERYASGGMSLNIDHHVSNDRFGDIQLIDPDAASSSELVYELLERMGGDIDTDEATCLYTGIVTDTGRFQYANTTPGTLRVAADLRELGVDHEKIAAEVYESTSFRYLHVLGIVLHRARLEDGIVWSRLDVKDLGGLDMDETEHFIDALRTVRESRVAVLLKQLSAGVYKASLRSRGEVDVSVIAKSFGGGGHERAAGFEMKGTPEGIIQEIKARVP